jgi:hypothetical protein
MLELEIQNLEQDIALLQHYIATRTKNSTREIPSILEDLVRHVFNALNDGNFQNLNILQGINVAAIDLADPKAKIAVQVTINANKPKINKTIAGFTSRQLGQTYTSLVIFGAKTTKTVTVPPWCTLWDFDDVILALRNSNNQRMVRKVREAFRAHVDYTRLHPYDDVRCLKIILHCIDRNAVKDLGRCEGSISEMTRGMREITELITRGSIDHHERCKPIGQFDDPTIVNYLVKIKNLTGDVMAIVHTRKNPDLGSMVYLQQTDMDSIDDLKRQIVAESNQISAQFSCGIQLMARSPRYS